MPITRRKFIKQSVGIAGLSFVLPQPFVSLVYGQGSPDRKIVVVIEMAGGNDGFNTVIPFTDSNYHSLRPVLSFKEPDLKDDQGRTTIISDRLGLHPRMTGIKQLYDAGKAAIVVGVGYPNPDGSHFKSQDIWHTGKLDGKGEGWLGRYASQKLSGESGLIGPSLANFRTPKTFDSSRVIIPNVSKFESFCFQIDNQHPDNIDNRTKALSALYRRNLPASSRMGAVSRTASETFRTLDAVKSAVADEGSSVEYPADNPLAQTLRAIASVIASIPQVRMLYVQFGQFDTHGSQIADPTDKLSGIHALQLHQFSEAVKLFHEDISARGFADDVVIMQWSEFGRRPQENKSMGTDHGSASSLFVIGNPVKGGLYGEQPSLASGDLNEAGNPRFTVDFRSVYSTILEDWLETDSVQVLGERFENIGFLR
jgi:uncharacterized protein (DUF1501 family)